MLNLGGFELLVILGVALIVLGPEKLPGVMRTAGKALAQLRRASTEFQRTINLELAASERQPEQHQANEPLRGNQTTDPSGLTAPEPARSDTPDRDDVTEPLPAGAASSGLTEEPTGPSHGAGHAALTPQPPGHSRSPETDAAPNRQARRRVFRPGNRGKKPRSGHRTADGTADE